jgi:hypothetical protein
LGIQLVVSVFSRIDSRACGAALDEEGVITTEQPDA